MYCAIFICCTTALTRCHSLPFAVTRCTTCCHLLSFVVTCCHSFSLVVPLVVTGCTAPCHSLSLAVIRCHSLSLDRPLVCLFINGHSYIHFLKHSINLLKSKREFNCFRRCPLIFFTCFFKYSFEPFILNICFQS